MGCNTPEGKCPEKNSDPFLLGRGIPEINVSENVAKKNPATL